MYLLAYHFFIPKIIFKGQGITHARTVQKYSFSCKHLKKFIHLPTGKCGFISSAKKLVHTLVYFMDILFSLSANPYAFLSLK